MATTPQPPASHPSGRHLCCEADGRPLDPTTRWRQEHLRSRTEPCGWSMASNALYHWLRKNPGKTAGDYPGYKPKANRWDPNRPYLHECGPADARPLEPTRRYYLEHRVRGTAACGWSKAAVSLYDWLQGHPEATIHDYPGYTPQGELRNPDRPYRHECGPADSRPLAPSHRFAQEHRRRNAAPCDWSLASASLRQWLLYHPDRTADDYPGWTRRQQ